MFWRGGWGLVCRRGDLGKGGGGVGLGMIEYFNLGFWVFFFYIILVWFVIVDCIINWFNFFRVIRLLLNEDFFCLCIYSVKKLNYVDVVCCKGKFIKILDIIF